MGKVKITGAQYFIAEQNGISRECVYNRMNKPRKNEKRKWTIERAITVPPRPMQFKRWSQ